MSDRAASTGWSGAKKLATLALVLTLPGLLLARAYLAYEAGLSFCFSPLGLVSERQRVDAVLEWIRTPSFRQRALERGGAEMARRIDGLRAPSCCTVERGGWADERKIGFASILFGGATHVVQLDRLGNWREGGRPPRIGTDVCGIVESN